MLGAYHPFLQEDEKIPQKRPGNGNHQLPQNSYDNQTARTLALCTRSGGASPHQEGCLREGVGPCSQTHLGTVGLGPSNATSLSLFPQL